MARLSTDIDLPNVVNRFGFTTLTSAIDNIQTTITLDNALLLSDTGGVIQIEDEIIKFESKTGNVLNNCVRGIDDTTPASHAISTEVTSYIVAENFNALKRELQFTQDDVEANEDNLGAHLIATAAHGVGEVLGTTEAQIAENKTFDAIAYKLSTNAATGINAEVTPGSMYVKLTDVALESVTGIVPTLQKVLILTVATGEALTFKNEAGTAANQIITGTDGDLLVDPNASLFLAYDVGVSKWRIIGGSGGGALVEIATSAELPVADDSKLYLATDTGVMYRYIVDGWKSYVAHTEYDTSAAVAGHLPGRLSWDATDKTLKLDTAFTDVSVQIGQELQTLVYNDNGSTIANGTPVYGFGAASGRPTVRKSQSNSFLSLRTIGVTTQDILVGEEGVVTTKGLVRGVNLSAFSVGDPLWVDDAVAGTYRNTKPDAPNFSIIIGTVLDNSALGILSVDFRVGSTLSASSDADITGLSDRDILQYDASSFTWKNVLNSPLQAVIGMSQDKPDLTLREDAGDLYVDVEKDLGGDILYFFQSGNLTLDCTTGGGVGGKATVVLTEGASASSPVTNYIYIKDLGGFATLQASTAFPTGEFCWVGTALVPDSTTFLTTGPYSFQRYSDSVEFPDERGALSYERERIRQIPPNWDSGVQPTTTITSNGGAPDNVDIETTSGIVYQMHRQTFPVFPVGTDIYVANDSVQPYKVVTDLNQLLTDAAGNTMSGRRFSLVLWGAVNKDTGDCKLYVNLPIGSYNTDLSAVTDPSNFAVTSIPKEFKGTGFLICRLAYRHQTQNSGTWSNIAQSVAGVNNIDLRGLTPGYNLGGASTPSTTEFLDDTFRINDNIDPTKQIAFEASAIGAGNTSIIGIPDKSGTAALLSDLHGFKPVSVNSTNDGDTALRASYYQADVATSFTLNLPSGADGVGFKFGDSTGNMSLTNTLTLQPAAGEKINGYAIDEPLILDLPNAWVILSWDATLGLYVLDDQYGVSTGSGGGLAPKIETANFTFEKNISHIVDTTLGPITGTLPAVADSSFVTGYADRLRTFGTNPFTIETTGADTVGGATSRVISDNAAAATMTSDLDNLNYVFSSNVVAGNGYIVDTEEYTPITNGLGTPTIVSAKRSRTGNVADIDVNLTTGTITAVEARIGLGKTITGFPSATVVGRWYRESTATNKSGPLVALDGNDYLYCSREDSSNTVLTPVVASAIFGTGETVMFITTTPVTIEGWEGGTTNTQTQVEYAYNTDTSNANDTASFASGPSGVAIGSNYTGDNIKKRIQFSNAIKDTDSVIIQVTQDTTGVSGWIDVGSTYLSCIRQYANAYGFYYEYVSSTQLDIVFAIGGARAGGATYGAVGHPWSNFSTWRWRVIKHSNAAMVGVEEASEKPGTLNYYKTADIVLDGGFSGATVPNRTMTVTRIGNVVTICSKLGTMAGLTSASQFVSASIVPSWAWPASTRNNASYIAASGIHKVFVESDGDFKVNNYNASFGLAATTNVYAIAITYTV